MGRELYKFDTSGFIYPYSNTKSWNYVFRVSFVLKDKVKPEILKKAISDMKKRFPTFFVKMTNGFFKFRLEEATDTDVLVRDFSGPCKSLQINNTDKPLFRIAYTDNSVSGDFFHAITDGYGASVFMKTLLGHYYELQGYVIPHEMDVLNVNDEPSLDETRDAFLGLYNRGDKTVGRTEKNAYQHKAENADVDNLSLLIGKIDVDSVKNVTRERGITITQLFVAAYIYAIYLNMDKNNKKPIKVSVPVNMRKNYPTRCLRNFSLYTNVGIDPLKKEYTLDDIIAEIVPQLKSGLDKELLKKIAAKNVKEGTMKIIDIVPNFIKKPILRQSFYTFGQNYYTTPLTNLGVIKFPDALAEHIADVYFVLGSCKVNHVYCAVCSYAGTINLSFSYLGSDKAVPETFFKCLETLGIKRKSEKEENIASDNIVVLHG